MVRGETKKLTFTVKNKTTGAVIDCSGASEIVLGVYQTGGQTIQKWSKSTRTGFGDIDIANADVGVLVVYLTVNELLKAVPNKLLRAEGKIWFVNGAVPGGYQVSADTDVEVEEVERSIFENVVYP